MKTWTDLSSLVEPQRIRALPRDDRGYPVPYFAMVAKDGKPDLRVVDRERWLAAVAFRKCGICGVQLGRHIGFVGGPLSIENRLFTDLPMHLTCAEYALQACPFLAAPSFSYTRTNPTFSGIKTAVSESVVDTRPSSFGLGMTEDFQHVVLPDRTHALLAAAFTAVTWWKNGQRSTFPQ